MPHVCEPLYAIFLTHIDIFTVSPQGVAQDFHENFLKDFDQFVQLKVRRVLRALQNSH